MRILYFHQHFSVPSGATGTRSYEFARRLSARGHHVTMVCGRYNMADSGLAGPFTAGRREGMVDGFRVIEFDLPYANRDSYLRRTWIFAQFMLRGIRTALREDYDLLFATSTPLTAGIPGIAARWLRGKAFVFEVRDLWPELPRAMGVITNPAVLAGMSLLEWLSYRSAKGLIGLSPGIVTGIRRRAGDVPVALVPNGCDLPLFADGEVAPQRPEGVGAGDLLAIYPGAHGVANGLDVLIDTAAVLQRRGRADIKIALVGDGGEKQRLMARAAALDLGNCLFLPPLPKTRLGALMAGADVGLMTLANVPAFYYGTSPNKFFDYIAAGLPVINNYPGWLAEMISEAQCGLVVAPDDPAAFADALEAMQADRAARARMSANARKLAERFDRTKLADEFVDFLEQMGR